MTHLIGLRGSSARLRVRAAMGTAIALSLLVFTAVEASHTHTESDPPGECYVCELGHQGAPTPAMGTAAIVQPAVSRIPPLPGHRLVPGIIHLSAHQSRAPPLPISL